MAVSERSAECASQSFLGAQLSSNGEPTLDGCVKGVYVGRKPYLESVPGTIPLLWAVLQLKQNISGDHRLDDGLHIVTFADAL